VSLKSIVDYRRHLQESAREELLRVTQAFAAQLDATIRLEQELERILEKIAGASVWLCRPMMHWLFTAWRKA